MTLYERRGIIYTAKKVDGFWKLTSVNKPLTITVGKKILDEFNVVDKETVEEFIKTKELVNAFIDSLDEVNTTIKKMLRR